MNSRPRVRGIYLKMWSRYRKWKSNLSLVLCAVALVLMQVEPDTSVRWIVGMVIAAVVLLSYVIEEVVWITLNQGRPCSKCGQAIRFKPFRLKLRCP